MEPARERVPSALLLLLLVLGPLLLHAQHLGPGRIPYLRDLSRTHLAHKRVAVAEMRAARLPLWSPGHGAGMPLLADANFFHFHPATLPFLVLPFATAFSFSLAALSLAAALGTAGWLRARGATRGGAVAGGLAFALGGVLASTTNLYNLHASYASVPWALWASRRLSARPSAAHAAALALALAATLLGGEPSAWGWALLFALALGEATASRPALAGHAAAVLLSLAISAAQLLPLAAATRQTARGLGFSFGGSAWQSIPPARLLELVWPYPWGDPTRPWDPGWRGAALAEGGTPFLYSIYLGAATTLLALVGLAAAGGRRARAALALLALASVVLALGRFTPVYGWLWTALPPLHLFRYPAKLLLGLALASAALVARGCDAVRGRAPRLPAWLPAAVVAVDLLAAHLALVPGAPARDFLEPPALAAELGSRRVYAWLERERWAPAATDRLEFHLEYQRRLRPPAGLPFGVRYVLDPDPDQLDPVRMAELGILLHRSDADRARLLPLLAADRVIAPEPLALPGLRELTTAGAGRMYAVDGARPLAWVENAARVDLVADAASARRRLADPAFEPRERTVFEGHVAPEPPSPGGAARIAPRLRPERIDIEADGPGLLVVAEAWSEDHEITIDGEPAHAAPANLAFIGIPLEHARRHRVRIEYRPVAVRVGLAISLLSLVVAGTMVVASPWRRESS